MSLTITIIVITIGLSLLAFNNAKMMNDLIFHPYSVVRQNQYYRFLTSGFLHADFAHLAFNMFTLYFFGRVWEQVYIGFMDVPRYMYLVLYIAAMVVADIPSYLRHKDDYNYRSLGASGAVSAVVFSMILYSPWSTLYVFFLPMPAIVYALLFLGYSIYMDKKGGDRINHGAHLWGAIFALVFTVAIKPGIVQIFLHQLLNPNF